MGILKSAADLVFTIRFLKLLVTPFEKTGAFKAGIINKDGKKNKDFDKSTPEGRDAYRTHYTSFQRLVYNIKRIMALVPGGQSAIARYGSALALIREHGELKDKQLMEIHEATGIDILDVLAEDSQWFVLEDNRLSPGIYRMKYATMNTDCHEIVMKDDKIRVLETDAEPIDEIFGISIYKGIHENSKTWVYFSTGEITR